MATCNPNDLLSTARCFACLTPQQLGAVQAELLCQILHQSNPMASCDVQSLLTDGKCFSCLTPVQLQVITTQLLCEILGAGGTAAGSCLVCGDVDPTDAPSCDCALAYNRLTGGFWYWDATLAQWVPLIV